MVNNSVKNSSHPKCFQCGSQLIFVSQEIVQPEGSRYPQINTVYRCSNEACQKKKDKDKADRQKLKLNKAEMDKERIERIHEKRRLGREVKIEETKN
jgi:hypothetical protein